MCLTHFTLKITMRALTNHPLPQVSPLFRSVLSSLCTIILYLLGRISHNSMNKE